MICAERWTECARRIERRPSERRAEQRSNRYRQTDGKACNFMESAASVNDCGEKYEHQEERHDCFKHHSIRARNATCQIGSTELHSRPDIEWKQAQQIRGRH